MSKKKKIVLVIAVLLIIGAGVGFYFYNKKKQAEKAPVTPVIEKDKDGNHLELASYKSKSWPDNGFVVLVNGSENGALNTLSLGPDGYYYGQTVQGTKYKYQQGWVLAA